MSIDVTNYALSKVPIQDCTELDKGTQVSTVREINGVKFDHHGVYIGLLDPSKESHQNLLRLYPELRNCPCVVDMSTGLNETCVSDLDLLHFLVGRRCLCARTELLFGCTFYISSGSAYLQYQNFVTAVICTHIYTKILYSQLRRSSIERCLHLQATKGANTTRGTTIVNISQLGLSVTKASATKVRLSWLGLKLASARARRELWAELLQQHRLGFQT